MNDKIEQRPWGYFEVLSENEKFKVKKIVLAPNQRLSLQKHKLRNEHWYILEGEADVTLNENLISLKKGQSIDIPQDYKHRVANNSTSNTVLIEIQTGSYFGEDDIIRFDDDYKRV